MAKLRKKIQMIPFKKTRRKEETKWDIEGDLTEEEEQN